MGVVVRRYIGFLILLIPTPLVSTLFVIFAQFNKKDIELLLIIRIFW